MEDKINVNVNSMMGLKSPISMSFLNGGNITIPGEYGGYVIASGCGSGKTTIIKELIKTQRYLGVIYSAYTIRECNEMYEYCKNLYISEGIEDKLKDEVIVLHSDYRSEGTNNNLWRNNPKKLLYIPIIICTHHKLLNEVPELLFRYRGMPINIEDLSPQQRALAEMNPADYDSNLVYLPRQLVLIDELPVCDSMKIKIDKLVIKQLGFKRTYEGIYNGEKRQLPYYPIIYDKAPGFRMLKNQYEFELQDKNKFIKGNDEISKIKLDNILGIIYDNYYKLIDKIKEEEKIDEKSRPDTLDIVYNASSLVISNLGTRIILFDGTGDLTFVDSKRFKLLTFPNKYNSPINLTKLEYNLKRYQKPNSDENEIKELLECNILKLKGIIDNNPEGTLIITWKNLKEDNYRITKGTLDITNTLLNENFSLPEYYKKRLEQLGVTNPFEVIHYMSGLDKATNLYRDFSTIVFLGEFHVPGYVVSEFNCDYSCNTNSENYLTYQLVQAVCRTRIRKHSGELINIYYTNDWNEMSIDNLINYISYNKVIKKDTSLDFIKPKWRNQCKKLMEISEEFRKMIEIKEGGEVTLALSEIYEAIPMTYKEVRVYYPLINYFRKLGIEITIKTNSNNKGYKS